MSYKRLEGLDWQALNGAAVRVEVSAHWITLELRDKTLLKIAKAKRPGHRKAAAVVPEQDGQGEGAGGLDERG